MTKPAYEQPDPGANHLAASTAARQTKHATMTAAVNLRLPMPRTVRIRAQTRCRHGYIAAYFSRNGADRELASATLRLTQLDPFGSGDIETDDTARCAARRLATPKTDGPSSQPVAGRRHPPRGSPHVPSIGRRAAPDPARLGILFGVAFVIASDAGAHCDRRPRRLRARRDHARRQLARHVRAVSTCAVVASLAPVWLGQVSEGVVRRRCELGGQGCETAQEPRQQNRCRSPVTMLACRLNCFVTCVAVHAPGFHSPLLGHLLPASDGWEHRK